MCCASSSSGNERPFPSVQEYSLLLAMNSERLAKAKDDILMLAPGPINRGVELTPEVADGRIGHSRAGDERPGRANGRAASAVRPAGGGGVRGCPGTGI